MPKTEVLLRKLRGHLAYAKQCEPFKIFRDVELEALLKAKPTTIEALARIKGFPKDGARVTKYGQSIIDCFIKADKIEDFEVKLDSTGDPVAKTVLKRMNLF